MNTTPAKTNTLLDKEPLTPGCCEWCGKDILDPGQWACSNICAANLHRLEATQGRLLIREMKRWRMDKNNAARQNMLANTAPMVDRFLKTDRKRREAYGAERRAAEAKAKQDAEDAAAAKGKATGGEPF